MCDGEGVGIENTVHYSLQRLLSCFSLFLPFHAPFPSLLSSPFLLSSPLLPLLSLNSLVIMFLDDVS